MSEEVPKSRKQQWLQKQTEESKGKKVVAEPKTQSQNEDSAMNVDDEVPTAEVTKDKGKGKAHEGKEWGS